MLSGAAPCVSQGTRRWRPLGGGHVWRCRTGLRRQGGGNVPAPGLEQEAFQRSRSGNVAEARQRLFLDLPHAFAGYAEQRADLLERHRLLALQSEIQSQDLRLALLECRQDSLDRDRKSVV